MANTLRIAMAQLNLLVGDIEGNTNRLIAIAEQARDELQADVVVFPELSLTGYPPEDLLLRQGLHRRVLAALETIKRHVYGIDMVIGYPHEATGGLYNAASIVRDGKLLCTYHKQHLPNYSVFDEMRYFAAGREPCVVEIKGVAVGLSICEDIWHPGPTAEACEAGARLIININASPFHLHKGRLRVDTVRDRASDGNVPVVYTNLVGGQDELVFDGGSFAMDRHGSIQVQAPVFAEGLYLAEFAIEDDGQLELLPGDCAAPLTQEAHAYQALVSGVRDYIDKNRFPGVVIGLSGGIDSALTLAVAVDAIGAERVEAVMMPSRYTADISLQDARAQAEAMGVLYREISIEPAFETFMTCLADEFAGLPADTTEENIQARCRGLMLMAISNKKGKMVLTTGNKSEMAVGYATLYGDMAGGFDVLKDVPKTLVFRLARYRNSLSSVIPERVITRPPSAELRPDQQDSDSLPPYEVLDAILQMYVEEDRCAAEIVDAGYEPATVQRVIRMVDNNEYKRRQAPPGVRITRRAFGRDRRYPITSGFGRGN